MTFPQKTLSRLITYKRLLNRQSELGRTHVFSHQIARLAGISSAVVRRDLMLIHYKGSPAHGYPVASLLEYIHKILEDDLESRAVLVGVDNFGRALLTYVNGQQQHVEIVAAFDPDDEYAGRVISGVRCHRVGEMTECVSRLGAKLGIISVQPSEAQSAADALTAAGVTGILNFAPYPIQVPDRIQVDNIDIGMELEKSAFLCR